MEKTLAGTNISVNEEGFMTDFKQWNKEVGEELAQENNVALTPRHWQVIDYIQNEFRNESPLSIRKVGKSGVV